MLPSSGTQILFSASPVGSESDLLLTGVEAELEVSKVSATAARGLSAAPGAGKDFERIWVAYGRYGNKQASKRAFEVILAPDVEHIVSRATAWAASAKPGQRRMPLEKWLAAEKYDEADRAVKERKPDIERYQKHQEDSEVRRERNGVDAAQSAETSCVLRRATIDVRVPQNVPLSVTNAHIEPRGDDTWLVINTDDGEVAVLVEGGTGSAREQEEGQAHLGRLSDACGIPINEPTDLCGMSFMVAEGTFVAPPQRPHRGHTQKSPVLR